MGHSKLTVAFHEDIQIGKFTRWMLVDILVSNDFASPFFCSVDRIFQNILAIQTLAFIC